MRHTQLGFVLFNRKRGRVRKDQREQERDLHRQTAGGCSNRTRYTLHQRIPSLTGSLQHGCRSVLASRVFISERPLPARCRASRPSCTACTSRYPKDHPLVGADHAGIFFLPPEFAERRSAWFLLFLFQAPSTAQLLAPRNPRPIGPLRSSHYSGVRQPRRRVSGVDSDGDAHKRSSSRRAALGYRRTAIVPPVREPSHTYQ